MAKICKSDLRWAKKHRKDLEEPIHNNFFSRKQNTRWEKDDRILLQRVKRNSRALERANGGRWIILPFNHLSYKLKKRFRRGWKTGATKRLNDNLYEVDGIKIRID